MYNTSQHKTGGASSRDVTKRDPEVESGRTVCVHLWVALTTETTMMIMMMAMATPMIMRIFMSFHHIFCTALYECGMMRSGGAYLADPVGPPSETLCRHGKVVCGSRTVSTARSRSTASPDAGRAATRRAHLFCPAAGPTARLALPPW